MAPMPGQRQRKGCNPAPAGVAVAAALAALLFPATFSGARMAPPPPLLIEDVSVIPMDEERVLDHAWVFVRGDTIAEVSVGDPIAPPSGAAVLDGRGRFLIPGLADMHVHLTDDGHTGPYVLHGITTIREMNGQPVHLRWRDQILRGERSGPRMWVASRMLDGDPPVWANARVVVTAEEAETAVREIAAEGYDFVKVYSQLGPEAFEAIVKEARRREIPVVGHVPALVGAERVLASGVTSLEHLHGYFEAVEAADSPYLGQWLWRRVFHAIPIDPARLAGFAARVKQSGVWSCPTLASNRHVLAMPDVRAEWETPGLRELGDANRSAMIAALRAAGAPILAGSDSFIPGSLEHGIGLHQELALLVEFGFTPWQALETATRAPARFLGREKDLGAVRPGCRADLVLLGANPLEDIANADRIVAVVWQGRVRVPGKLPGELP